MIIGFLGMILFVGAIIAFGVNNINTPKNPKPVTPEEKKKRTERNLTIAAVGAAGIGAMKVGVDRMERTNRGGSLPGGGSFSGGDPTGQAQRYRAYAEQQRLIQAVQTAQPHPVLPSMIPTEVRTMPGWYQGGGW